VIISASYRTDIPAFYGEWMMRRLREGYCRVRNPYSGKPLRVDLRPENVTAFVFWTRNFGPLLAHLDELKRFGRPFVVQYTITGYPRALEAAVIPPDKAVEHLRRLSDEVHPRCGVWRYDPVVFSSVTDESFHLRNFEALARELEGSVDEVVISFAQLYKKTLRNMAGAGAKHGFTWTDPPDERKVRLRSELAAMARARGMQLTVCTQQEYTAPDAVEARCIDARRLSAILGAPISVPIKGNRPGCACHESRDIGEYDTCPHGCAYCYAVQHRALALRRYKDHDPAADSLVKLRTEPESKPTLWGGGEDLARG
jgi:hypothetical protein